MSGPELSEDPDGCEKLGPCVSSLRREALQAGELSAVRTFSDGFLIKFLRARDSDVELSLKVRLRVRRDTLVLEELSQDRRR